jgi:hypothetical protein
MLKYSHPALKNRLPFTTIKKYINSWILLILIYACQEDPSKLGLEFLQDSDMLDVALTDTVTVEAFTLEREHVLTNSQYSLPLGSYADPVFGHVKAEFLAQFAFSDYVDFGLSAVCDSLVIELFCLGNYGNGEFTSNINVYELTSDLVDSINYYSDFDPAGLYNSNKINVSDAIISNLNTNDDNTDSSLIQIYLSNFYGNKLINPQIEDDSLFYTNDSVFKANIKGLYFSVNQVDEGGLILYALPSNILSRIALYYHNLTDTLEYSYYFYGSYVRAGIFDFNNHNGANIPYLNNTDFQDTAIYLQSLGGTVADIKFPHIDNLIENLGRVSVNKAELIIPVLADSIEQAEYKIPGQLGLRSINAEGDETILPDDPSVIGLVGYFGGIYEDEIKAYKFNIGNYIQRLINGNEYNDLRLFVGTYDETTNFLSYNVTSANRVVLASGNNSNNRIILNIFYTKIP